MFGGNEETGASIKKEKWNQMLARTSGRQDRKGNRRDKVKAEGWFAQVQSHVKSGGKGLTRQGKSAISTPQ